MICSRIRLRRPRSPDYGRPQERERQAQISSACIADINDIERCVSSISFDWVRTHDSGGAGGMRWFTLRTGERIVRGRTRTTGSMRWWRREEDHLLLGFTPNWCASSTPNNGKYDNGTTVTGSNQNPTNLTFSARLQRPSRLDTGLAFRLMKSGTRRTIQTTGPELRRNWRS